MPEPPIVMQLEEFDPVPLEHEPESPSLQYNLACLEALEGDREAALERLRRAIELEPRSTTWARADDDFESLRDDPRFAELTDNSPARN